jgi:hypothetical protein
VTQLVGRASRAKSLTTLITLSITSTNGRFYHELTALRFCIKSQAHRSTLYCAPIIPGIDLRITPIHDTGVRYPVTRIAAFVTSTIQFRAPVWSKFRFSPKVRRLITSIVYQVVHSVMSISAFPPPRTTASEMWDNRISVSESIFGANSFSASDRRYSTNNS